MKLDLSKIIMGETQTRVGIDPETVNQYAEAMTEGATFPEIEVYQDGDEYHLADGYHRVAAARQCRFKDIEARIIPGTRAEALWAALGANKKHGLRMNRADVRKAIGQALRAFPERSNREIGAQIGCSHNTVAEERKALESTGQIDQLTKTVGADGKARPARQKSKTKADDQPADESISKSFAESYHVPDESPSDESTEDNQDAEQLDPDCGAADEDVDGLPAYNVVVRGRNINAVRKRLSGVFGGSGVLSVEKQSIPKSRADRLDKAAGHAEDAKGIVEELLGEIENWRDGLPENLQGSEKADQLNECADGLQTILDALGELDFSSIEFPGMC